MCQADWYMKCWGQVLVALTLFSVNGVELNKELAKLHH